MSAHPGFADGHGLSDPTYARICQMIRKDILAGEFPPGSRLKISELTKRYGVSQMPIREALQQLQGEWLVTIAPNRGASVRQVDAAFIRDMYDVRGQIEALLTRQCCLRVQPEELETLKAQAADCERQANDGNHEEFLKANQEFHSSIYTISGNAVGSELLRMHFGLLRALRSLHGFGAQRLATVVAEHRELVEAIVRKEAARAALLSLRHCESAKQDLLERIGW
jgi:DNA-binding GntR family transcriptional regulator